MDEVDVVVPRNKVAEFVKFTKDVEKKHKISKKKIIILFLLFSEFKGIYPKHVVF